MITLQSKANTILFVDDEDNILNALKRELHGWARERSLTIKTAPSAAIALNIIQSSSSEIAVIVSDLKMPEMLGSDFLLEVKNRWPEIITVLLTGFSETQEVMKAVKAGIFSYILKPWEPEYLKGELDKALEMRLVKEQNATYARLLEDELRWAGEMQKAMLRPTLQSTEGIELRVSYQPVPGLYCGGDYYDVVNLSGDRYLILLGDVSGHGVKAAFITGILKAVIYPEYIRTVGTRAFSPGAFLGWLNERMNFELRQTSDLLISFFAGVLDRQAMTLTYANAGQDHPFIISGGIPRELHISGSVLGVAKTVNYAEQTERLKVGDMLFAYTDGLVEAGSSTNGARDSGIAGILAALPISQGYHKAVLEAALAISGVAGFEDDVTILTARLI
ncbi:MAG: SpoIIE family protein phosphatase [Spirochaetota bacterium]